jgi:hypothetical protein
MLNTIFYFKFSKVKILDSILDMWEFIRCIIYIYIYIKNTILMLNLFLEPISN